MRNVKRVPNLKKQTPLVNKWGKRIAGGILSVALGTVAYNGVNKLAQTKSVPQKGKPHIEHASRAVATNNTAVRSASTNLAQRTKSYTNNIPRLKAIVAKRVTLSKTQLQGFDSLARISQSTGFGSARVMQNIYIYQKEFSNPNYQRATVREKQELLGTGDMRVIAIGNAYAQLPQSERNAIRSLFVKGIKEELWGVAGEERVKANREAMGFSD